MSNLRRDIGPAGAQSTWESAPFTTLLLARSQNPAQDRGGQPETGYYDRCDGE